MADDSYIVREGLTRLLRSDAGVEIVASCADMGELLQAVEREGPEVVITDIRMPPDGDEAGIEIAARLRDSHPEIGIVVLSQYSEPGYVLKLLDAGSDGRAYLLKERVVDGNQLSVAIRAVAEGGSVIDPKVVEVLVDARARADASPLAELTPRELDVLSGIAQGKSNAAIADELVLSKRAVEKQVNAIFQKLGLTYDPNAGQISKRVRATLIFLSEAGYRR